MGYKILFIDDEESICFAFKAHLQSAGYEVAMAADYHTALDLILSFHPDLIVADIILGGHTGIDLLREVKQLCLNCPVIMITGEPNVKTAMEAVRLGAFDYLAKPIRKEMVLKIIRHALKQKSMAEEKEKYRRNLDAVFTSIQDGIITVDDNLTILEANQAFSRICGLAPGSLSGQNFAALPSNCAKACLESIRQTLSCKNDIHDNRVACRHEQHPDQVIVLSTAPLKQGNDELSGVVMVVRDVTRLDGLERELGERYQFHNIIGKSKRMQEVYNLLEILSDTDTTVLICGESGTGKELVARALHHQGHRSKKQMVAVDCSALTESILESELFGHIKGAFTGATGDKPGRFQMADGGTVFLDEIGNISPKIQQKILRFLQEKEIERVGDTKSLKLDVRIIAATNLDLKENVKSGKFREDLYYRLKVMEIFLPSLREKTEDIPLLVDHFIKKFNNKLNRRIQGVSKEVMAFFPDIPLAWQYKRTGT